MKIDSCLIVKNEEKNLRNVINNLLKFSSNIYVVDTGSTDSTPDIIRSYTFSNNVHFGFFKWTHNFSEARNYSISLSQGADYIFWCDGDETLSDEFVNRLVEFSHEEYSNELPDIYIYGMTTKNVFTGGESHVYARPGIFKANKGITFSNPIHEIIVTDGYTVDEERFSGHMLTNYYDKKVDERFRNFEIFGNIQNTRSLTCREMYYSGIELLDVGYPLGAYLLLIECVKHPDWYTEAIDALYVINQLYNKYEACRKVTSTTFEDIARYMLDRSMQNKCVLCNFGNTLYNNEQYELAVECYELAYNMSNPGFRQILTDYHYNDVECLFWLVLCYDKLRKYNTANMYNNKILELDPNNQSAIYNKKYFSDFINEN